MTLFDLKNAILKEICAKATLKEGQSLPDMIHISKTAINTPSSSKLYHDIDNGKTLKEISLKDGNTINIKEKSEKLQSKVPLFNDEMTDINDRAKFIFNKMWDNFCVDDPDCPGRKIMGRDEITLFIIAVTKQIKTERTDPRVTRITEHARTIGNEKLTQDDFIQFYRESCFERVDTVRENLIKYNYRQDLKEAAVSGADDNVM
jgi:hypothetical protein